MAGNTRGRPSLGGEDGGDSPGQTVRLPQELKDLIKEEAALYGVTASEVIRRACWWYFDEKGGSAE